MKSRIAIAALLLMVMSLYQNCGGTILENPADEVIVKSGLSYLPYGQSSSSPSSKVSSGSTNSVQTLKISEDLTIMLCIRHVRFYMRGSGLTQYSDVGKGLINLDSEGSNLGDYDLVPGPYYRVKMTWRGDHGLCPNDMSVRVINQNGDFMTTTWLNADYDELRQYIEGPGDRIELEVNTVVNALKDVTSDQDIVDRLLATGLVKIDGSGGL